MQSAAACQQVGSTDAEFEGFLQDLLAKTAASLKAMPPSAAAAAADWAAVGGDVLQAPRAQREDAASKRQACERARRAAMEDILFKERPDVEKRWKKEVRQRKEKERKQREFEAAQAAQRELQEELVAPACGSQSSPRAAAREMWHAEARVKEKQKEEAADERRLAEQQLLEAEWEPMLARHREAARARRQEAARAEQEAREEEEASMRRERQAMAGEDRASASFVSRADAECRRLEASPVDPAARMVAEALLLRHRSDRRRLSELEDQRKQAEANQRRKEEESKEREYRHWKEQVRSGRCQQHRPQGQDLMHERGLESQSVLEATLKNAEAEKRNLKDRGGSPRRLLEKARALADEQRKERDSKEPARLEQELWDSLLAKNRLAKQQERGLKTPRTPRWGLLQAAV